MTTDANRRDFLKAGAVATATAAATSLIPTAVHAAGDDVLKAVAALCRTNLRASDVFGRLGGEEFAILLPHIGAEAAMVAAEKLRAEISAHPISGDFGTLAVTASFGISALSIVGRDTETLLAQADSAMYRAKSSGRNRCISWSAMQTTDGPGTRRRVGRQW